MDDIFWVAHLHAALDEHGYHPGDEEVEAWVFGEQTLSALLTFQAGYLMQLSTPLLRCFWCPATPVWAGAQATQGLEETGVCDADAWRRLLCPEDIAAHLAEAARLVRAASIPRCWSFGLFACVPGADSPACARKCRLPALVLLLVL